MSIPNLNDLSELARATSEFDNYSDLDLAQEVYHTMWHAPRTVDGWPARIGRLVAELDKRVNRS